MRVPSQAGLVVRGCGSRGTDRACTGHVRLRSIRPKASHSANELGSNTTVFDQFGTAGPLAFQPRRARVVSATSAAGFSRRSQTLRLPRHRAHSLTPATTLNQRDMPETADRLVRLVLALKAEARIQASSRQHIRDGKRHMMIPGRDDTAAYVPRTILVLLTVVVVVVKVQQHGEHLHIDGGQAKFETGVALPTFS